VTPHDSRLLRYTRTRIQASPSIGLRPRSARLYADSLSKGTAAERVFVIEDGQRERILLARARKRRTVAALVGLNLILRRDNRRDNSRTLATPFDDDAGSGGGGGVGGEGDRDRDRDRDRDSGAGGLPVAVVRK
jgi:hypothetical protein